MRELYIHVGLHRTATTFLQLEVFPKLKGINYIPQRKIYSTILREISMKDQLVFSEEKTKNQLSNYFTEDRNLISAESLCGSPFIQYTNRSNILRKIYNMFPEAKIIVGVRAQKDIIASIYKYYVKIGGIKKFSDFIAPYKDITEPISNTYDLLDLDTYKYSNYLEKIESLFSRKNMYIYVYENLIKNKSEFIKGILDFMTVSDIPKISYKLRSVSWNDAEISTVLLINRFIKTTKNKYGLIPRPKGFYSIIKVLSKLPIRHKKIISDDMIISLKDFYRKDNLYLDERYKLFLQRNHFAEYF